MCKIITRHFSVIIFFLLLLHIKTNGQQRHHLKEFVSRLDTIREKLKIPGMQAAVMEGDSILFVKGFGYADVKNHTRTTESTTFRVASVTKTFTSTLVMQLVEQGKLDLNKPISDYGLDFGNAAITVKHLLTHTSENTPGSYFQYNGYRFGRLGPVIEKASGIDFYQLLMEQIVQPAGMNATAPSISINEYFDYLKRRKQIGVIFENTFSRLAKPYGIDANGNIMETSYLNEFGAFGGLATCAGDLLKYSAAIDRHQFVSAQTQQLIFSPNKTTDGNITPYGYGWFTQNYKGVDFYWHYGQTQGESALFVKVPSRKLTFVVLANSFMLSQPFPLGDGDLFTSPLGQLFYRHFINADSNFHAIDYGLPAASLATLLNGKTAIPFRDFYNKEIITQSVMSRINGDTGRAMALLQLYAALNFTNSTGLPGNKIISAIRDVSTSQDISRPFTIDTTTSLKVYGVGENCSADLSSWCDYGWIEDSTGKVVWQMQAKPATHAGGAIKNQRVEDIIRLLPGNYKLRYKSDYAHAYNNWDSAPPDHYFWGIVLFLMEN